MATTSRSPYWFMLDRLAYKSDHFALSDDDDDAASTTLQANSVTSDGKKFGIGFKLADPPRPSRLQVRSVSEGHVLHVVAAHRHVLLAQMTYCVPVRDDLCGFPSARVIDYFLCTICPAASLEPLPSLVLSAADQAKVRPQDRDNYREFRRCHGKDIGILALKEEEFVVAELVIKTKEGPVLNVLFCKPESRPIQWEVKYPSVTRQRGPDFITHLLNHFEADQVIPLGGRWNYLCWVDFSLGCTLICDMCADRPRLHYRSLPAKWCNFPVPSRTMHVWFNAISVTRTGVMKFVKVQVTPDKYGIFTRGFTVTSWIKENPHWENWVQDGVITSDELSLLLDGLAPELGYRPLMYPLVSMDDWTLIYFMLKSRFSTRKWIVGIDMRNKKLRSSFDMHMADPSLSPDEARYIAIYKSREPQPFLPVEISKALPHEPA